MRLSGFLYNAGEPPVAFLVLDREIDTNELIAWSRNQLAAFKVPKTVHIIDALSRNALEKVQKHLLPSAG
jgi:O-succinylbenzoic acid--CoA ligase